MLASERQEINYCHICQPNPSDIHLYPLIFLFDRQQLADYLCIDRAAMSTEISKLQKEGFIKTNRNHFELMVSNDVDSTRKM